MSLVLEVERESVRVHYGAHPERSFVSSTHTEHSVTAHIYAAHDTHIAHTREHTSLYIHITNHDIICRGVMATYRPAAAEFGESRAMPASPRTLIESVA